jgi:naringenin degradation protein FdeH
MTRRIVTGHRQDGRSTVLIDGRATNVKRRHAGNASTLLWVTDETPADVSGGADRADREIGVPPPARGTIFRIAEFPPGIGGEVRDNESVLRDFGIGPDVARGAPPRHPAIHRTRSLDYVVVLEGEIALLLDDGESPSRQAMSSSSRARTTRGSTAATPRAGWRWYSSTLKSPPYS